jgi:DNA polymerase-3 subunit alpha
MEHAENFVHLHLHTVYSLLDGACDISELIAEAARRGMPAVAITDHGNLFAAANFFHEATTHGVKPIIGCEVNVAPFDSRGRDPSSQCSNHLVLLAENEDGYRNLIRIASAGFLSGSPGDPRVDQDILAQHSKGIIALSGCLRGEVAEALLAGNYHQACANADRLRDIFGKENFFLELQDHGIEAQKAVNRELVRLSRETAIPLVATNDCHYLARSDAGAQEVLMCIRSGKTMSDPSRMKPATDQLYFKTAQEMAQVFHEIPEALECSVVIAARCNVKIQPVANSFPEFRVSEGHTVDSYFEKVVREGFATRLPQLERFAREKRLRHPMAEYEHRLSHEISLIQKMRLAGYFLIVWDFISYARVQEIPVGPGRGSAAGSLVSYALHITDIDPLQHDLLFERFLNPERVSMPDIDIDFCAHRRQEVIDYVRRTYGENRVAQIITFGTMGAKAAIRDVGRALDMSYGDVDRIAKLVPNRPDIKLEDALKLSPELDALRQKNGRVKELIEIAQSLEGRPRHASTHAAGIVIAPQPLADTVPLYKSSKNEIMPQYDMNALERIGLLKIDFLGLATLTVLDDAIRLIGRHRGIEVDASSFPLDDVATYALFSRGDTTGVFQFESDGMRDILRRYQPTRHEDLTALNALYRPGPIQGGMIKPFIDRKHGKKKVTYDLPELEEVLSDTFGVMIYQEQVMRIANRIAGFSLGDADILRRAMAKKRREAMAAQRTKFLDGCNARNVSPRKAEHIFDLMAKFAEYGFPKSHACAYALLAYQTAYLKAHYPVEYMTALLTSKIGDRAKVTACTNECHQMGIQLLAPDVNSSGVEFQPDGNGIRFGLAAIKDLGEKAARAILEVRDRLGRFDNLRQFSTEIDSRLLNKRAMDSLVKAGALDSLGLERAQMIAALGMNRGPGSSGYGRRGLSSNRITVVPISPDQPNQVTAWSHAERLAGEQEVLGTYVTGHPLDQHKTQLDAIKTHKTSSLDGIALYATITVAGFLAEFTERRSQKGNLWGRGRLDDFDGSVELVAFDRTLEQFRGLLVPGNVLIVEGRLERDAGDRPKMIVVAVEGLNAIPRVR